VSQSVIAEFEESRDAVLESKRAVNISGKAWPCDRCGKVIDWPARVKPPAGPPRSVTDPDRRRQAPASVTSLPLHLGGPVIRPLMSVLQLCLYVYLCKLFKI